MSDTVPGKSRWLEGGVGDAILTAKGFSEVIPRLLGEAGGASSASECDAALARAYRAANELRRDIDRVREVMQNRQDERLRNG